MMPKRIQMRRDRPWRRDNPDAVIVARPSKWGLCHFWGKRAGYLAAGVSMDFWDGHEQPRGSDTCGWHNADPVVRDQVRSSPTADRPAWKTEGEPAR